MPDMKKLGVMPMPKKGQKDATREPFCFVSYQKKRYSVRVIVAKLPEDKANQVRNVNKEKQAKTNINCKKKVYFLQVT